MATSSVDIELCKHGLIPQTCAYCTGLIDKPTEYTTAARGLVFGDDYNIERDTKRKGMIVKGSMPKSKPKATVHHIKEKLAGSPPKRKAGPPESPDIEKTKKDLDALSKKISEMSAKKTKSKEVVSIEKGDVEKRICLKAKSESCDFKKPKPLPEEKPSNPPKQKEHQYIEDVCKEFGITVEALIRMPLPRSKKFTQARTKIVHGLHSELGVPKSKIAKLLNMDLSNVKYLFKKPAPPKSPGDDNKKTVVLHLDVSSHPELYDALMKIAEGV